MITKIIGLFLLILLLILIMQSLLIAVTLLRKKNTLGFSGYSTGKIYFVLIFCRLIALLRFGGNGFLRFFINTNNRLIKIASAEYNNILILLPRCLQNQACTVAVAETIKNCKLCGKCGIAELNKINYTDSTKVLVATGSEIAKKFVIENNPDLVIAIACERELFQGLNEIRSVPVYAVINGQPEGPCKNTTVDIDTIREALKFV